MSLLSDLQAADASGDAIAYYNLLSAAGDSYGALALGVVLSNTMSGTLARAFAASVAAESGVTLGSDIWALISINLMDADLAARALQIGSGTGSGLNLSYKAIQDYHHQVFDDIGLPENAWTANIPLNTSTDPQGTWEAMLGATNDPAGLLNAGLFGAGIYGSELLDLSTYLAAGEIYLGQNLVPQGTALAYWVDHVAPAALQWMAHLAELPSSGDVQPFEIDIANGGKFIGGGDATDDILLGTSSDDVIVGYRGNDIVHGGSGHDHLYGAEGDDILHAGNDGGDVLDGGADDDTAVFLQNWFDYSFSQSDGAVIVTEGSLPTTRVLNVESFQFANGTIDLSHLFEATPTGATFSGGGVVEEGLIGGQVVGTVHALDPNTLDRWTYAMVGASNNYFTIDEDTGVVTAKEGVTLDYEAWKALVGDAPAGWAQGHMDFGGSLAAPYCIEVAVTDSAGACTTDFLYLNVQDKNEAPGAISYADPDGSAWSNRSVGTNFAVGTVVAVVSAADPDAGDAVTWSLVSNPTGKFAIDPVTGQIKAAAALVGLHACEQLVVRATDSHGLYDAAHDLTLTLSVMSNVILGTPGNDTITSAGAYAPFNAIYGLGGNDTINGGHNDKIYGGDGDDVLSVGQDGYAFGGNGHDTIYAYPGNSSVAFGPGGGVLSFAKASSPWIIDIGLNSFTSTYGGAGIATTVTGTFDKVVGGPSWDYIYGSDHGDVIDGGGGADKVYGRAGNDTITVNGQDALVFGDDGDDVIKINASTGGHGYGGAGSDVLTLVGSNGTLDGGADNDILDASGGTSNYNWLIGGAGADTLIGRAGAIDYASWQSSASGVAVSYDGVHGSGTAGDALGDTITNISVFYGSDYADVFNVKLGMYGAAVHSGAGDDTITANITSQGTEVDGDDGDDQILVTGTGTVIHGGNGNDTITGSGTVYGDDGDDHIFATGAPNGLIHGGNGSDTIVGRGTIYGDAGDDRIQTAAGNDTIYLGDGHDTYVMAGGTGTDHIMDFNLTDDTLEIDYGLHSFADVLAHSRQSGSDLVIDIDASTSIALAGHTLADLGSIEYVFA